MGKQGPCYHCGVTSTPLWRNGPPEKPVLCNACGSRWRTKGSLTNYTPLHSRADADEYEDHRVSKAKTPSRKTGDETPKRRKLSYESPVGKRLAPEYNQGFLESIEEDTGNRSSSGSASSNSESFVQFSSADASDLTGSAQSAVWETQVPSKKRTSMARMKSASPVEKFIKDLHAILHEQQSSYLSGSSEEDLLFGSDVPMVSVEIGHGSVLIKHPSSCAREEDSEASSLSFENKTCETMQQKPAKRDQLNHGRMQHFLARNSPLCYIDVNDIINLEVLMRYFTNEEKKQLLNYLPPDDTSELPESLENMFDSSCFKGNVLHFQQLLSDGIFSSGAEVEGLKTLRNLTMSNLPEPKRLELYTKIKGRKSPYHTQETEVDSGSKLSLAKHVQSAKRPPLQEQKLNIPGKETLCVGKLFHLPMDSCHDECASDEDLLLDLPLNGSFPEAELLLPPSSITSHQTSTSCSSIHSAMIHH